MMAMVLISVGDGHFGDGDGIDYHWWWSFGGGDVIDLSLVLVPDN